VNHKPIDGVSASSSLRFLLSELLIFAALIGPHARASDMLQRRFYELTTETGMPHLEENLRYTITRQVRCLSYPQLFSAFPILGQESLKGCKLGDESRHDDVISYVLICDGRHGTTGTAQWRLGADLVRGTLDVKLGGKNMTFYQRIAAKPLGECVPEAK
jgi:hypothetical protein